MGRPTIVRRVSQGWLAVLAIACTAVPGPTSPAVASAPTTPPAAAPNDDSQADRSSAAMPAPAPAPDPAKSPPPDPISLSDTQLARARAVQKHVIEAAAEYDVDPNLINAIIWNESKFDPKARNRSGARGLMQLMPTTSKAMARALGVANRPYDPEFSIRAGTYLFSRLRDKFDGDVELALFGYARGSGGVRSWQERGGPMPEGVQKFIARVRRAKATFDSLGFPRPSARDDGSVAYQPSRASSSATRF